MDEALHPRPIACCPLCSPSPNQPANSFPLAAPQPQENEPREAAHAGLGCVFSPSGQIISGSWYPEDEQEGMSVVGQRLGVGAGSDRAGPLAA